MPLALAAGAENLQILDYGVDYEAKNNRATTIENSNSSPQVLRLFEDKRMKGWESNPRPTA